MNNDNLADRRQAAADGIYKAAEARRRVMHISDILGITITLKALHVKTRSYARHMALDTAFEGLNGALDGFIECVQGYYRRKDGSQPALANSKVEVSLNEPEDLLTEIAKLEDRFKAASDDLVKGVSPLVSLQDDVLNCFYQLYYRLDLKK